MVPSLTRDGPLQDFTQGPNGSELNHLTSGQFMVSCLHTPMPPAAGGVHSSSQWRADHARRPLHMRWL